MKLIDLYNEWMNTGLIKNRPETKGQGGLCNAVPEKYLKTLELFEPDPDVYSTFWGYNGKKIKDIKDRHVYGFSPMRQAVVLMICAIHNEL